MDLLKIDIKIIILNVFDNIKGKIDPIVMGQMPWAMEWSFLKKIVPFKGVDQSQARVCLPKPNKLV